MGADTICGRSKSLSRTRGGCSSVESELGAAYDVGTDDPSPFADRSVVVVVNIEIN